MLRKLALPPFFLSVAFATTGWLYLVRLDGAPKVRQALPLDELAKRASASLWWFVAIWLVAGFALAAASRWARIERLTAAFALSLGAFAFAYLTTGTSLAITRQIPARDALHLASKLGVIYLPPVIVGIVVAAFGRSQRVAGRGPAIVATVVAIGAAFQLLHAMLPPGDDHGLLRVYTPEAVGPLARAAGASAVVALLFAARGLARRRRRAWKVATALAVAATFFHLVRDFGPGALVSLVVLIVLLARRHDF